MNISDFGFDSSLNIPGQDTGTPVVYDGINDAVATQQLSAAGNLTLKNLTLSGISKMAAPGDDLQAVINAVYTSGGGTVLMKSGIFTQKTPLIGYTSVALQGVSPSATIIAFEGASNLSFTGTNVYTTGTITSISSGVFVTGSGTAWLTKAKAGQYLFIGTRHYLIAAVTSDTTLILAEGYVDNITMPGAAYRITSAIVDVKLSNFSVQGSTGTGITFTDAPQITIENVISVLNNKGFSFTNVSRLNIIRTLAASNTSNGFEFTNIGQCEWRSVNASANGGHNFVMNNVKTVSGLMSAVAATGGDGFNCTDMDDTNFVLEASGNSGQGVEFVTGCDENTIDGLFIGNASDGVKLTANDDRNIIRGIYKGNGGYGINIAASSDDDNTIDVPIFSGNSSGTYNDSGTNTNVVATITQPDSQTFTSNGTWTKPANSKIVFITCVGAGGGGGGGASSNAGAGNGGGGTGGGGASITYLRVNASDLTSTVAVSIGTGGTAGTGATAGPNNGGDGGIGGNSSFGTFLTAYGGGGGRLGAFNDTAVRSGGSGAGSAGAGLTGQTSASDRQGGTPAFTTTTNGISGQGAAGGSAKDGYNAEYGGGGGGGWDDGVGSVTYLGGSSLYGAGGGGVGGSSFYTTISGKAGGTSNSYSAGGGGAGGIGAGTSGTAGSNGTSLKSGSGGGGGAGNNSGAGGAAGAGGTSGGGGGGGGAGSTTGGAGGAGGRGEIRVISI